MTAISILNLRKSPARVVWKFPLHSNVTTLDLPVGAQVLNFDWQHGTPHLWVLVEPSPEVQSRRFRIVGTGHAEFGTDEAHHIGTAMVDGGTFVFHLFELVNHSPQPIEDTS